MSVDKVNGLVRRRIDAPRLPCYTSPDHPPPSPAVPRFWRLLLLVFPHQQITRFNLQNAVERVNGFSVVSKRGVARQGEGWHGRARQGREADAPSDPDRAAAHLGGPGPGPAYGREPHSPQHRVHWHVRSP
jgi:hypothetical protein